MSQVEAIYRRGVFEPLERVDLVENQRVVLQIEPARETSWEAWLEDVRRAQQEIMSRVGVLPDSAAEIAEDRRR